MDDTFVIVEQDRKSESTNDLNISIAILNTLELNFCSGPLPLLDFFVHSDGGNPRTTIFRGSTNTWDTPLQLRSLKGRACWNRIISGSQCPDPVHRGRGKEGYPEGSKEQWIYEAVSEIPVVGFKFTSTTCYGIDWEGKVSS